MFSLCFSSNKTSINDNSVYIYIYIYKRTLRLKIMELWEASNKFNVTSNYPSIGDSPEIMH